MDAPSSPPLPQRLRTLAALMAARIGELALLQTAASLAFLSLLALVPVFTIAISLLGASPVFAPAREALLQFLSTSFFLPGFSQVVLKYLNQFAAKAGQLSLIGGLAFFATAFSALLTINRTLNRIWRVRRPRSLAHRLTLYWVFLTLGPLVFAISIAVNAQVAAVDHTLQAQSRMADQFCSGLHAAERAGNRVLGATLEGSRQGQAGVTVEIAQGQYAA